MKKLLSHTLQSPSEEPPAFHLTPMIDVVFILLISFILIAPILPIDSVHLSTASPSKKESTSSHAASVQVAIRRDGSLWVEQKRISLETLRIYARQKNKTLPAQVAPDVDAPFGVYQQVKMILEEEGFSEMEVLLFPS